MHKGELLAQQGHGGAVRLYRLEPVGGLDLAVDDELVGGINLGIDLGLWESAPKGKDSVADHALLGAG